MRTLSPSCGASSRTGRAVCTRKWRRMKPLHPCKRVRTGCSAARNFRTDRHPLHSSLGVVNLDISDSGDRISDLSHLRPAAETLQVRPPGDSGLLESQARPCAGPRADTAPGEMSRVVRDFQLIDARGRPTRPAPSRSLTVAPGLPKPWPFAPGTSTARPPRFVSGPRKRSAEHWREVAAPPRWLRYAAAGHLHSLRAALDGVCSSMTTPDMRSKRTRFATGAGIS